METYLKQTVTVEGESTYTKSSMSGRQFNAICMILQAFRELYAEDADKYYTADEFYDRLAPLFISEYLRFDIMEMIVTLALNGLLETTGYLEKPIFYRYKPFGGTSGFVKSIN